MVMLTETTFVDADARSVDVSDPMSGTRRISFNVVVIAANGCRPIG
jgi:hypothetical protein